MKQQDWISRRFAAPRQRRLYCLPYAGGSTAVFSSWPARLGPDIEVCPVLLPGREARIGEPTPARMADLVPPLAEGLAAHLAAAPATPYALFGHSMGALIAFEVSRRLAALGLPAPERLFLSAAGPVRGPERVDKHRLDDRDLLQTLRRMNGTPAEFFDDPDLVALLLPMIRADFTLAETFSVPDGVVQPVPITAFAGAQDGSISPAEVDRWRRHTTGGFDLHVLPGDHFYIHAPAPVLEVIARHVSSAHPTRT